MWLYALICNLFCVNSGLPCECLRVSVSESRKVLAGYLGNPRIIWFRSLDGSASVQPPPPRTSPCLSPSLGASRVGCGPSPTCGHAALHRAEDRAGEAATRTNCWREAQGVWRSVRGPRQDNGAWQNEETTQKCKTGVRWWRDGAADGDDDLQRRWRQTRASGGAVQALESGDEAQDFQWRRESRTDGGNRLGGGDSVRIWRR